MTGRRSHGRLSALNGVVHQGIQAQHLVDVGPGVSEVTVDRLDATRPNGTQAQTANQFASVGL